MPRNGRRHRHSLFENPSQDVRRTCGSRRSTTFTRSSASFDRCGGSTALRIDVSTMRHESAGTPPCCPAPRQSREDAERPRFEPRLPDPCRHLSRTTENEFSSASSSSLIFFARSRRTKTKARELVAPRKRHLFNAQAFIGIVYIAREGIEHFRAPK